MAVANSSTQVMSSRACLIALVFEQHEEPTGTFEEPTGTFEEPTGTFVWNNSTRIMSSRAYLIALVFEHPDPAHSSAGLLP